MQSVLQRESVEKQAMVHPVILMGRVRSLGDAALSIGIDDRDERAVRAADRGRTPIGIIDGTNGVRRLLVGSRADEDQVAVGAGSHRLLDRFERLCGSAFVRVGTRRGGNVPVLREPGGRETGEKKKERDCGEAQAEHGGHPRPGVESRRWVRGESACLRCLTLGSLEKALVETRKEARRRAHSCIVSSTESFQGFRVTTCAELQILVCPRVRHPAFASCFRRVPWQGCLPRHGATGRRIPEPGPGNKRKVWRAERQVRLATRPALCAER